uniref:Amino acid permease/ SLC12A domain-containing protein n=1 Tax=Romanomermis culicivorax TaxID=13658 RepID=A0A915HTZ0_ROMCU
MAASNTSNGAMGRRGTEDTVPSMAYYEQGAKSDDLRSRPSLLNLHSALNQAFVPDAPNQTTTHSLGDSIDLSAHSNFDDDVNKQRVLECEICSCGTLVRSRLSLQKYDLGVQKFVQAALTEPHVSLVLQQHPQMKFGWIRGVLIRCILSILGTLIYLRLGWVAGQAGILIGVLIAAISTVIVTLTALSMCALCTNGEINAGGAYFMLSRSLGPEFGGSMGVIFALADAVAAAMNVVGFAETVRDLLLRYNIRIVDSINDVRIIGAVTMLILFTIGKEKSTKLRKKKLCNTRRKTQMIE